MNRLIKISILLVFAVAICLTSGKVFNIEIGTKSAEKITELGDSTACFAEIVENFSYYEYTADNDCYLLYDKSEKLVGKALFSMPYCADIKGYAGNVPLVVLLSPDDKVQKVHLLDNNETPSFLDRVVAKGFLENWTGLSVDEAKAKQVDAVTGATYSSSAISKSVRVRLETYAGSATSSVETENMGNLVGFIASMVFLLFAGFCFWEPQRTRKFRIVLLLASIGILGFWLGQFISIAKLSAWLVSGVNWQMEIFLFIVLVAGIMAPLFLGKQFYCMYVCPFGACQELVGKINPKHKLKISPKVVKVLRYARYVLLVVLGALLCTSLDISIENFEPFSAFKFQFASLAVLILAGVMLVLSIFINRPWCTFLCPTGAFFSLFMKKAAQNSQEKDSNTNKE
ncbi:MAG: 4Fe-4S binding protein [Bacteroidales bacterium]|nr:4Fe-4S binding protein [Bacteroidales bacterium]